MCCDPKGAIWADHFWRSVVSVSREFGDDGTKYYILHKVAGFIGIRIDERLRNDQNEEKTAAQD